MPLALSVRRRRESVITGITVFAGMLGVTLFGLFLTRPFYVVCASVKRPAGVPRAR